MNLHHALVMCVCLLLSSTAKSATFNVVLLVNDHTQQVKQNNVSEQLIFEVVDYSIILFTESSLNLI